MQEFENFKVARDGNVVRITLCRPDALNTMTHSFWSELPQVFQYAEGMDDARVIVLDSQGKHFCAGMDVSVFMTKGEHTDDPARQAEQTFRSATALQGFINTVEEIRVPVLCAIQGGCIGGAVDLVTAGDLRYCTKDAFFCIAETNIGITADVGTLQRLPKLIPLAAAKEIAYTGRRVYGEEAAVLGLVTRAYDSIEEMNAGVMEVAQTIASKSPLVITGTKVMLNFTRDNSVDNSLKMVAAWNAGLLSGSDLGKSLKDLKQTPEYEKLLTVKKYPGSI